MNEVLAQQLADLPECPGCYVFRDTAGTEIYVGKAKQLKRRVRSYFQRSRGHLPRLMQLVSEVASLHIVATDSEVEALLLENQLIKELQPRYNVRLKDDKDYPLLGISREEFPRVFITRDRDRSDVDLIGPFGSMTELKRAYHFLMRVFRFRNCDLAIREDDPARRRFRPCLNYHIKRCSAPCTTHIDRDAYKADIKALRAFLSGRGKARVMAELRQRMQAASQELCFEKAARYRDQLQALERLQDRGRLADLAAESVVERQHQEGLESLRQALQLPVPPRIIEGFDLAHLQGEYVVAGMVQFIDGKPNPNGYRRYKIRTNAGDGAGNNDYAGMAEVVGRRYRRVKTEDLPVPDVVLIDGGAGQVAAAKEQIEACGLTPPCLVGLAKQEETLVFPDGREQRLGRRHGGLKVLMHVRDEAHRFCRRYFHLLQHQGLRK